MTTTPADSVRSAEATGPLTTHRLAGLAALAFAAGVLVSNGLLSSAPMADESAEVAAAWFADNRAQAMVAAAMVAITFPALLVLGGSMYELSRRSDVARGWMVIGALGAASMVGVFTVVAAAQMTMVTLADSGVSEGIAVAWGIHNAAFALNMSVLGTAFFGFAMGAGAAGLTPGWQRTMGLVGAAALLITGFANLAVSEGSPVALLGFAGFLLWLAWLVILGIRLVRR